MLTLLYQLLAELFITGSPDLEPGIQSPYASRALSELDSRFFRMHLPTTPNPELGKLNRPSQLDNGRAGEVAQPSKASQAVDDSFEWSCK